MKKLLVFLGALPAFCALTSITGPLYTPAGDLFGGTITVSLNNPATAQPLYNSDGRTLTGFATRVTVTAGAITLSLEANDAITPAGTSYTARFQPDSATGGGGWAETWVVPTSGSAVQVYALRSTTVPIPSTLFSPSQLTSGGATAGQFLKYSGTSWQPYTYTALTDPTTTTGDIIYRNSGGALTRLGIGSASQVLTVSGGLPAWASAAGAVSSVFSRTGAVTAQTGDYTAAQVTGAVSTAGSYADPSWITSLAYSKLSGAPSLSGYVAGAGSLTTAGVVPVVASSGTLGASLVAFNAADTVSGSAALIVTNGGNAARLYSFDAGGGSGEAGFMSTTPDGLTAQNFSVYGQQFGFGNLGFELMFTIGDNGTATVHNSTATTGSTELVVEAGEGQSTNNLQTWRNNAGSTLSAITSAGAFTGTASTASALAANPADCTAGQYANAIAASGDLTCAAVAYSQVSGTPTLATVATSGSASDLGSGTLAAARGGAGTVSGVLKANGSGVVSAAAAGTDYVAPAGNVATATALAANGANCSAGTFPLGVNASGAAEGCVAVSLTADVSGVLPVANGGTNNAFFTVSGPATSAKTYTFPNASATVLTSNAAVTIGQGGTGTGSTLTGLVRGSASAMTAAELSGDATTSGSNAVTVTRLNGTSLAGLATGILKNTTSTGVPSIAVAGTDYVVPAGNVATATALAANGTNCSAGSYPLGVDASGNAESCTAASGSGTVTSVSVTTANGVSGSVATATSTPAITLTLGAITPTSVAAVGTVTGSNLSGTNTGDQTAVSGNAGTATVLQTARLINGTSFNGSADITITANLTSNPTACTAGQYVSDIAADGTLTCGTPAGGSGTTQAQALTLVSFRF